MDTLISIIMDYYLYILAIVGFAAILSAGLAEVARSEREESNELPIKSRQVGIGRVTLELVKK